MRISAKADYAVRAALELAAADGAIPAADAIGRAQAIPTPFLQKILRELQCAGIVATHRGREGGHRLARPAGEITIADILLAAEGPLAEVHGRPPSAVAYDGAAAPLQEVWVALEASIRAVLEGVTLADLLAGGLQTSVGGLVQAATDLR